MKIVFSCRHDYYIGFERIARLLKENYGWQVSAITFNDRTKNILQKSGCFGAIYHFPDFMESKEAAYSDMEGVISRLREIEDSLGVDSLNTIIGSDRMLFPVASLTEYIKRRDYTFEETLRMLLGGHDFLESLLNAEKPDYLYGEIGNAVEHLAWLMCSGFGAAYMAPVRARIMPERFVFSYNPVENIPELKETYDTYRRHGIPQAERKSAEEFLSRFISDRRKASSFSVKSPLSTDIKAPMKVLKDTISRSMIPAGPEKFKLEDKDDLTLGALFSHRAQKALRYLTSKGIFEEKLYGGDYFFYPLHMQPEIATLMFGPFYDNQLYVIESIARSLPVGYKVVVKEHPLMLGRRYRGYYKEISKFRNVQLVSPLISSHEVMEGSKGMITVAGTVGMEAILYGKPVVMLGSALYDYCDLVHKAGDIKQLPSILKKVSSGFRPAPDSILAFVASVQNTGYVGDPEGLIKYPHDIKDENIQNIADAILKETSKRRPI